MSLKIKGVEGRQFGDIVRTDDGKYFYLDSCWTEDCGWETMAFPFDIHEGDVDDWLEVYGKRYADFGDMLRNHNYLLENLEVALCTN